MTPMMCDFSQANVESVAKLCIYDSTELAVLMRLFMASQNAFFATT